MVRQGHYRWRSKSRQDCGSDDIVAQGTEAGGHRGAFEADKAEARLVGLFSLLPAVADAVKIPVVASGGIADERGVAAALLLGASAVQIRTELLRCSEAKIPSAGADAIGRTAPEDTMMTRAFSGRPGRSIATDYARAAAARRLVPAAPYPVQRGLTLAMRDTGAKDIDIAGIQAWAGQSAARRLWEEAKALLG